MRNKNRQPFLVNIGEAWPHLFTLLYLLAPGLRRQTRHKPKKAARSLRFAIVFGVGLWVNAEILLNCNIII